MNSRLFTLTAAILASAALASPVGARSADAAFVTSEAVTTLELTSPFSVTLNAADIAGVNPDGHVGATLSAASGAFAFNIGAEHAFGVANGERVHGMLGFSARGVSASVSHSQPLSGNLTAETKADVSAKLLSDLKVSGGVTLDAARALSEVRAGAELAAAPGLTVKGSVALNGAQKLDNFDVTVAHAVDKGEFTFGAEKEDAMSVVRVKTGLTQTTMVDGVKVDTRGMFSFGTDGMSPEFKAGTTLTKDSDKGMASVSADATARQGAGLQLDFTAKGAMYGTAWSTGVLADAALGHGGADGKSGLISFGWGQNGQALTVTARAADGVNHDGDAYVSPALKVDAAYNAYRGMYALRAAAGVQAPLSDLSSREAYGTVGASMLMQNRFGIGLTGGAHLSAAGADVTPVFGVEGTARLADNAWMTAGYNLMGSDMTMVGAAKKGAYLRVDYAFVKGAFR